MKRKRKHFIRLPENISFQSVTHQISKARQAGFDGVDWPVSIASLEKMTDHGACELSGPAERIMVGSISTACTTTDIEVATKQITVALRAANTLGAICLNLSLPSLSSVMDDKSVGNEEFMRVQDASNFAYSLLRNVRFEAEAAGVAMALEVATGRCFNSAVELRELVDALHSWAIGICVDVTRVSANGCPVDWLQTLLYRVHAVRMDIDQSVEVNSESDRDRSIMHRIFTTLQDVHFDGALIVTTDDSSEDHWSDVPAQIARFNRSG